MALNHKLNAPRYVHRNVSVLWREYTAVRAPDAHAINDLALQNYIEMRSSVLSPAYRLRKWLEEKLSVYLPGLGWQTKYSRVSFSNERYSEVVARSDYQGKILLRSFVGLVGIPLVATGSLFVLRYGRAIQTGIAKILEGIMTRP